MAQVSGSAQPAEAPEWLDPCSGAFVTIHRHGELRGCVGHIETTEPLARVIRECAIAACSDPRFEPVEEVELPDLDIELSLPRSARADFIGRGDRSGPTRTAR